MPTPLPPLPAGVTVSRSPGTGGATPPAPIKALDTFAGSLSAYARTLHTEGYGAVGAYYFKASGFKHLLGPEDAHVISASGLRLFSVYENGQPTTPGYFTVATANMDAHVAHVRATDAGQPAGTPVFFAVDYDAAAADLPAIEAYFLEIRRVFALLGDTHRMGVYGSGLVCKTLRLKLLSCTWLAQSTGFAGYKEWLPHADIVQGPVQQIHGMDCDTDTILNPAVLWSV